MEEYECPYDGHRVREGTTCIESGCMVADCGCALLQRGSGRMRRIKPAPRTKWVILDEKDPMKRWTILENELDDIEVLIMALGVALNGDHVPIRKEDAKNVAKEVSVIRERLKRARSYASDATTEARERTLYDQQGNILGTFFEEEKEGS